MFLEKSASGVLVHCICMIFNKIFNPLLNFVGPVYPLSYKKSSNLSNPQETLSILGVEMSRILHTNLVYPEPKSPNFKFVQFEQLKELKMRNFKILVVVLRQH